MKGEIIKSGLLKRLLLDKRTVKVLETWQGHLDDLFNMKKDIKKLLKILYEKSYNFGIDKMDF